MLDDLSAVFEAPIDSPPDADELVTATMTWHFSPATGSPFWLGKLPGLGFDPTSDVKTVADLALFDTIAVDWSRVPAADLIPRGCLDGRQFGVYESGGTTGAPKRIVDAVCRRRNVEFQSMLLDEQDFPRSTSNEGWLHIGPTGPHVMSKNVGNVAELRGFLRYFVDLDPRWVKKLAAQGRQDEFDRYLGHILDQVADVLASQPIRAISTTPRVLERIVARPDVYRLMKEKVRGIIWGGTSMDDETLRLLEHEAFPDTTLAGAYGNTMMGVAPQRTRVGGDPSPCVFRPYFPYTIIEVVDKETGTTPQPVDASGRVKITTMTREQFLPPTLERDVVTRRSPVGGYAGIEVSEVRPDAIAGETITEGVY
ncbi:hypothetical protein [Kibdelosporangium aridum]|uniref:hypothetical protein n=1 Tax=Kibdelosporangium aridum TaxID=2030 RepID=UPI0005268933